jgi:signal transduction histidine kinase
MTPGLDPGNVEQVQEQLVDVESSLRVIQRSSERALTVVVDLMDAAGSPVITRKAREISAVVTAAVDRARPLALAAGAEIEWKAGASQLARMDSNALGHVLDHLLENALKFGTNTR